MTVSDHTLTEARRLLVERGWGQGCYGRGTNGPYCILGALLEASSDQRAYDQARKILVSANPGIDTWAVNVWNDAPDRTIDDVLTALDRAINILP